MNKYIKRVMSKLSKIDINIIKNYKFYRSIHEMLHPHFLKRLYKQIDTYLYLEEQIPIRIYIPNEKIEKLIIFFHGGGWTIGNIESYDRLCSQLSLATNCFVVAVEYPLAPENPFPLSLNACYKVVKHFWENDNILNINSKNIILMGDSAGGNIAAVLSLMGRDKKDFNITKQILIYPLTYHDHSIESPFLSNKLNGNDYLLTCEKVDEYMKLYVGDNVYDNPYIAPLNAVSLKEQPKTLIITAEFDPLRDEGEAYGEKLIKDGNKCEIVRMENCVHGFFNSPILTNKIKETYKIIKKFING